jgi:hypothetical protein
MCFIRQSLRKMWPIELAFLFYWVLFITVFIGISHLFYYAQRVFFNADLSATQWTASVLAVSGSVGCTNGLFFQLYGVCQARTCRYAAREDLSGVTSSYRPDLRRCPFPWLCPRKVTDPVPENLRFHFYFNT